MSQICSFQLEMGPEFKPGYRACLMQTGHKLSLNLILGPDLVTKNNVFVSLLTPTAGVPARKRSRGGLQPSRLKLCVRASFRLRRGCRVAILIMVSVWQRPRRSLGGVFVGTIDLHGFL